LNFSKTNLNLKVVLEFVQKITDGNFKAISKAISLVENEHDEAKELLKKIYKYTGKAYKVGITGPPGAGSNSTKKTIKLAKHAKELQADAILTITPYYNKPTQQGLYAHFAEVASAVDIPIIMYNVPGRTGVNMTAETTLKIAEEIPNVVGIKESSGNLIQIMQIIKNRPEGFKVYSGDDSFAFPVILAGGDGVISVASNEVPSLMKQLVSACLEGQLERARELHYKLLPLMEANFIETNPIPVKAAMAMLGLIKEVYRLPLVKMNEKNKEKLRNILFEVLERENVSIGFIEK